MKKYYEYWEHKNINPACTGEHFKMLLWNAANATYPVSTAIRNLMQFIYIGLLVTASS